MAHTHFLVGFLLTSLTSSGRARFLCFSWKNFILLTGNPQIQNDISLKSTRDTLKQICFTFVSMINLTGVIYSIWGSLLTSADLFTPCVFIICDAAAEVNPTVLKNPTCPTTPHICNYHREAEMNYVFQSAVCIYRASSEHSINNPVTNELMRVKIVHPSSNIAI